MACSHVRTVVSVRPDRLIADGYDTAVITVKCEGQPKLTLVRAPRGTRLDGFRVHSGVVPGRITVRVDVPNSAATTIELTSVLDPRDRLEDGTPDFLRLDREHDRIAFRQWFTYAAETQYFEPRAAEIVDCAALIRYAYREALLAHDSAWAQAANLPVVPPFGSVEKYAYPHTPLNASLFRVSAGPFRPADLSNGAFWQFADAKTLLRFNTHFFSRDLSAAQPGDLLFFRQHTGRVTYHSMIYLGLSQIRPDGHRYVVYHTGADPGELRRLTVEQLEQFSQPEWRPLATNPNFLGVARWNILP